MKHKLLSLFVALIATTTLGAQNNVITYTATSKQNGYEGSLNVGKTTFGPAITSHTFSNGTGTITFEDDVTTIGDYAFCDCFDLTSITIPNSVTTIGDYAFYNCIGLTSITIPSSVTTIGYFAFSGCSGLTSVTIPNSVTTIGLEAFSRILNIVYSGTATGSSWGAKCVNGYIDGYFVYSDATKTKLCGCSTTATGAITIPNSVTTIGDYAFCDCFDLTSITIPNSVTTIGSYAFYYCSGLTSVTIPNSVTTIGRGAFSSILNIVYSGTATGSPWGAKCVNGYIDGYFVYSDATKTKLCGCSTTATGAITIPNSVTTIGSYAFYNCSVTSVTIPNSVTTIGDHAFYYCSGLTSVTIPNSVTTIGEGAFYDCSKLTSVTIPNSVTTIGSSAFYNCSGLTSVTIPNSVTTIGYFAFSNVNNIAYSGAATGSPWGAKCVNGYVEGFLVYSDATRTKLCGCSTAATGAITIPHSVTTIGNGAFDGCSGLTIANYYNYSQTALIKQALPSGTKLAYRGVYLEASTPTSTAVFIRNVADTDKKVYSAYGVKANGQIYTADNTGDILLTSLHPNTTYNFVQCVKLTSETEWKEETFNTFSVTTPALTLTTLTPKVVSAGTAIVAASTNISDYETNVGFEWRKETAPEGSASKSGAAILCNGIMEGRLLNLGTDWWKVRPYYESTDGTRYYGEWEYIDPTDASYFEPTVHTYAMATSPTSNKTQVRGYVMTGTDDVTEQGFEYWFKGGKAPRRVASATPDSIYRVQASGQVMTAVLENLAYSTTYTCRAYAIAGGKTYYGEEVQFLTPEDPRPIYTLSVMAGENGSVNTDVSGQYREGEIVTLTATAEQGFRFVQWSDGNTDNPRQLTMTANTELVAIFELADGLEDIRFDQFTDSPVHRFTKIIRDNHLLIFHNGKTYNALGGRVK